MSDTDTDKTQAQAAEAPALPFGDEYPHQVPLPEAIKRLSPELPEVTALYLKAPGVRELRGIKLGDLLQFDADALAELLPRIARPKLSPAEVDLISARNFVAFGNKVATFLQ